jgi:LuxR family maltose regulon positive regulatory protein
VGVELQELEEAVPAPRGGPSFELFEPKLHPPPARSGAVERTDLVDRMMAAPEVRVVSVIAPPGAGKTTLLSQWAERREGVAWVSVDERDNDPAVFLTYAAAALNRVETIDPRIFRTLEFPGLSIAADAIPRLTTALASMQRPAALVFDHLEQLQNRDSLDALAQLTVGMPRGAQLVIASRTEPPLPMTVLRSRGDLFEISAADLAMDAAEARALLTAAGVELDEGDVAQLCERTEGWPVGLYLAALSLKDGTHRSDALFAGDDRLMADYLRSELVQRLPQRTMAFLTRTAILDELTGPLCDYVLGSEGSAEVLASLERSHLLVVALDRQREWFRYQNLFRDMLRAELKRREPELVPELHRRASTWSEANGRPEAAIAHAQKAGDADRAARIVAMVLTPVYATGRVSTVRDWIEWFEHRGVIGQYPAISVQAALFSALLGHPGRAESWAAAAETGDTSGPGLGGESSEAWLALLRSFLCRDGIDQMRADAVLARDKLRPASAWRPTALLLEAVADLFDGDDDRADSSFAHAYDVAIDCGAVLAATVALAERALIHAARYDWSEAERFAEQALSNVDSLYVIGNATTAFVYAVNARTLLHRGEIPRAEQQLALAARLRPLLTYAVPTLSAQTLLEMATAYLTLADTAGARTVLRDLRDILRQRPDLGFVSARAEDLEAKCDAIHPGLPGASSLTTAELRLLPLLATHLTFPEIGERLYVSRNTVKTQAISIYQKLGVSSRNDAIERARRCGLLGG